MHELYIYYRVRAEREAALREASAVFAARLCQAEPGLQVRWRRRPAAPGDDLRTWMEIWTHPDGVGVTRAARIEAAAAVLQGMIEGSRHVEAFEPIEPCDGGAQGGPPGAA